MTPDHSNRDYRGQRVLCMGLGSFGGGAGAIRFLAARGARLTVTDARPESKLAESLAELGDIPEIEFKLGGHDDEDFRNSDLIVVNPAVKRNHPCLDAARRAGVALTSEMNLFWQWNPAPVVAVTGSNGKSTTTAMTHSILSQTGRRCWLGGNIGISLLPRVDEIRRDDLVVLELSSFQLTDLDRLGVSPAVSVVTNFSPNHIDWHETLDHYRWAKQTMLRWQQPGDTAVLNADDADVSAWSTRGARLTFGLREHAGNGVFATEGGARVRLGQLNEVWPMDRWLRLPGRHNIANAMAATCAALSLGVDQAAVQRGLESYKALPHRLQFVGEVDGRRFYNDSLATTPESAEVGLEAFESPVILLAGGYDKKVDLSHMADAIARRAKAVALMGQTGPVLRDHLNSNSNSHCVVSEQMASLAESLEWAIAQSSPGDVILLSPGCASYDWFRNFADRGAQFEKLVRERMASAKCDI